MISPILQGYGFPTKIVEALACGKPTITTPVGGRALEKDYRILEVRGNSRLRGRDQQRPRRRRSP